MKYENLKQEGIKLIKKELANTLEQIQMVGFLVKGEQMKIQVENLETIKDFMGDSEITERDVEEAQNLIDEEMEAFEEIQELAIGLFEKIKNFGNGIY